MREIIQAEIKIQGKKVTIIWFTDDIAVLTKSEEDLQNILKTKNITFKHEYNIK